KTVPMILSHAEQWDHEALTDVLSYGAAQRQVWDNTDIEGPWLNLMRNALNSQIWSFNHPDFLAVSVTHGTAQLALYDQAMWDKYQLTKGRRELQDQHADFRAQGGGYRSGKLRGSRGALLRG